MDVEDVILGAGMTLLVALIVGGVYIVVTTQSPTPVIWSCQSVSSVQFLNSGWATSAKTVVDCSDGRNMVFCNLHPDTFVVGKPASIGYNPHLFDECYDLE